MTDGPASERPEGPVLPAHQLVALALTRPLDRGSDDAVARVQRVLLEALHADDTTFQ
ncbi:hypothetical protein [Nocardiopsis kunsanensis]|uniref:Uncharacterized protein n=1 Tax=Nocardiopsis kunsanensis TaxID=141693 RepID=A0A919CMJ9_9ACTN|nr:hypothetical protein [Nocardiopsis kunsanensis]GHD37462.1 hypothetical protein GCM10007147_45530 [Nocardiopsis kunsanensis]